VKSLVKGPGYFVTGTDTGIGKTWVACRLAELARAKGLRCGVLKPAESGDGGDTAKLARASRCRLPMDVLRPYAFKLPLAPAVAAAREGKRVRLSVVMRAFRAVRKVSDFTLVEGAGGLLVPYAPKLDGADIAKAMGLPLIIVARRGLGTINHSLLTLEAARRRGLKVAAVVLSGRKGKGDPSVRTNARQIARLGKVRVISE
jgi:dethiobiotin synthetase